MKFGIVVFPGTNCDHDCHWVLNKELDQEAEYIWHKETKLPTLDCLVLAGGFSYGDYLRTGSIAKTSPIMKDVISFANKGGLVIGICNGFQILLETGLLPGAMLKNNGLKFICESVPLSIENNDTPFTKKCTKGQVLKMPVRHMEGNYFIDNDGLKGLIDNNQIVLKYSSVDGLTNEIFNPNGSVQNIAGICNKDKNVFGLMPHPEAACDESLGSVDGKLIFESLLC